MVFGGASLTKTQQRQAGWVGIAQSKQVFTKVVNDIFLKDLCVWCVLMQIDLSEKNHGCSSQRCGRAFSCADGRVQKPRSAALGLVLMSCFDDLPGLWTKQDES